jgi:hypothetical protein
MHLSTAKYSPRAQRIAKEKWSGRARSPRNRRRAAVFTEAMEPAETQRQACSLPLGESAIDSQCRIRKAGRKEIP